MIVFIRILLAAMVLLGLRGAGQLSYKQYLSGDACPVLGDMVPACYIAFLGFILITLGVALRMFSVGSAAIYLFWIGLGVAGGLAAIASVLELISEDAVCPVAFGSIPMCYISLVFTAIIAVLFIFVEKTAA